jgi:hypothetical protein
MDTILLNLVETAQINAKKHIRLGNLSAASANVGFLFGVIAANPEANKELVQLWSRTLNNVTQLSDLIRIFNPLTHELDRLRSKNRF